MKDLFEENAIIKANSKQLDILKKNFPSCFDKEGAFNPEKLEEIVRASGADITREGYSLNWLGKSYSRFLANENIRTLMAANVEHNQRQENKNSQNLLIQGDNLEVLKHLKHAYYEKVKMIYIDPPYNTGSDGFVYNDDRKFTVDELSRLTGLDEDQAKRVLDFTMNKSNSHSAWLTFLFPRLYIARELLRDDGVIFISIDDNEQAQLKLLCDEVFGEENFVGNILWKKKTNGNNMGNIPPVHDYLIVYAKYQSTDNLLFGFKADKDFIEKTYKNPDNDPRGAWTTSDLSANHEGPYFEITNPATGQTYLPPKGRYWVFSEDEVMRRIKSGEIIFGKTGKATPVQKKFLTDKGEIRFKPESWWDKHGYNSDGTDELLKLFKIPKIFVNSKPTVLLKKIIEISTQNNDLILDFFAGSGTTAHAVMQLNAEDGGNRNYICVQIDEKTDKKSEAHKAGYKTIFEITRERIKRAAAKIKEEHPDATCDFGFQEFRTIEPFPHYLEDYEDIEQYEAFKAHKLSHEERMQLMLTWQLHDGLPMHLHLTPIDFNDYTAYQGEHILYFMDNDLCLDHIIPLLERLDHDPDFIPRKVVILGGMLNDKSMREIQEAINGYNNRKGIELTLDIRF